MNKNTLGKFITPTLAALVAASMQTQAQDTSAGASFGGGSQNTSIATGSATITADDQNVSAVALAPAYAMAQDVFSDVGGWAEQGRASGSAVSVIAFKSPDQKTLDETTEDLRVMSLLMSENISHAVSPDAPNYKLGIPLLMKSQGRAIEASYVEGLGALFTVKVRLPVVAPTAQETNRAPAPKDTAWSKAQRELSGTPEAAWTSSPFTYSSETPQQPYRSNLVEALKKQVLKALGEASNFRHIGADEHIVVTIIGTPNVSTATAAAEPAPAVDPTGDAREAQNAAVLAEMGAAPRAGFARAGSARHAHHAGADRSTVLTIRIKESDAKDLAANKLSEEAFFNKAEIATYLGPKMQSEGLSYSIQAR